MLFSDSHILSTILFTPLVGAILMLFIPREQRRRASLDGQPLRVPRPAVSLPLIWRFSLRRRADFQFIQDLELDSLHRRALSPRHRRHQLPDGAC